MNKNNIKTHSYEQEQTKNTFEFKWKKRHTYESENVQKEWKRWLFEKYFDGDEKKLESLLDSSRRCKKILDAGCGSGGSGYLLFGERLKNHNYLGIDISESINVAKERFSEFNIPASFLRCDLNSIPEEYGPFDIIFSEGVLHHTDSVEKAIYQLSKYLKTGGYFLFYVYSKKAPIREFTDDYIRKELHVLNNEQAWASLMPLTKFGKKIGDLNIEIEIDEDIPYLGIKKGKHNLQRFFFYNFFKVFYRPEYSLEEMNHINFDWFRPLNCFRHTPEEIEVYCTNAKLEIKRLHVEDSGITVIAQK